jgi:transposase InsO family protein
MKTAIYRRYYNEVRPHSSLGNRPPAEAAEDWKSNLLMSKCVGV